MDADGVLHIKPGGSIPLDWNDLPEEFTPEIVRRLTIANLRRLRAADDLTPRQRDSFDKSYALVMEPMLQAFRSIKLGPVFPKLGPAFPKLDVSWPKVTPALSLDPPMFVMAPGGGRQ